MKCFPMKAAILSGGRSRRMGRDKSFMLLDGAPLISRVEKALAEVFDEVFVISNRTKGYEGLGLKVVKDILPGNDSLGGLHTAVSQVPGSYVFVAACDMPFLQPALLRYMAERADGWDVVLPIKNKWGEPLCALYSGGCEPHIRRSIKDDQLKLIAFHQSVRVLRIEEEEWRGVDPGGLSFVNINTPEEFTRIEQGQMRA